MKFALARLQDDRWEARMRPTKMIERYVWRVECTNAKRYEAKKPPTCGCQKCWEKWDARQK